MLASAALSVSAYWLGMQVSAIKCEISESKDLAAIRSMGIPTPTELAKFGPQYGADAGPHYIRFAQQIEDYERAHGSSTPFYFPVSDKPFTQEERQLFARALPDLIEGSKQPRWIAIQNGGQESASFQSIAPVNAGVEILCRLADEDYERGDINEAIAKLTSAENIIRQEGENPCWTLASENRERYVIEECDRMLRTNDPSVVRAIGHFLNALPDQPSLKLETMDWFVGFTQFMHDAPDNMYSDRPPPNPLLRAGYSFWISPECRHWEALNIRIWRQAFSSLPRDESDWQGFAKAISDADRSNRNDRLFAHWVTPSGEHFGEPYAEQLARRRIARAAVRLRLQWLDTGHVPVSLAPNGEDTIDPFFGRQLIYKPMENGFLIYSVGRNRKDDGGKFSEYDSLHSDIVATVTASSKA